MRGSVLLALRYLRFYPWRTAILVVCLSMAACLPLALRYLLEHYRQSLTRRAESTPLVLGKRGSRFDLAMSGLYFKTNLQDEITVRDCRDVDADGRADTIAMLVRYAARGVSVVGVEADYYSFRDMTPAVGTLPFQLGDAVLGATAAIELGLGPGDTLITDRTELYNLAAEYPLRLNVSGVLNATDREDDGAVFVDIKTAWVIAGIGHGHGDLAKTAQPQDILERRGDTIVASDAVRTFVAITPDNVTSFHFHLPEAERPASCALVIPNSNRDDDILKARYRQHERLQLVTPVHIVDDLMATLFRIETIVQASFGLALVAMLLLLGLVALLSIRLRQHETTMLRDLGCSRTFIRGMFVAEWLVILFCALLATLALVSLTMALAPDISALL